MRRTILLGLLAASACQTEPARYPDRTGVEKAHAAWCSTWHRHDGTFPLARCKAAYPTASAAYLQRMTKCVDEIAGEGVADRGRVRGECRDRVIYAAAPPSDQESVLLGARCRYSARCEKISEANCRKGFAALEGPQRAALTTIYNERAQRAIAACFDDAACGGDDATTACYRDAERARAWLP